MNKAHNPVLEILAIIAGAIIGLAILVGVTALFAWMGMVLVGIVFAGAVSVTFAQAFAGVILLSIVGGLLFHR